MRLDISRVPILGSHWWRREIQCTLISWAEVMSCLLTHTMVVTQKENTTSLGAAVLRDMMRNCYFLPYASPSPPNVLQTLGERLSVSYACAVLLLCEYTHIHGEGVLKGVHRVVSP